MKASDPTTRRGEVETQLKKGNRGSLQSFWKTPDTTQLYAIVEADAVDHGVLTDIKANGHPIAIEEVPESE